MSSRGAAAQLTRSARRGTRRPSRTAVSAAPETPTSPCAGTLPRAPASLGLREPKPDGTPSGTNSGFRPPIQGQPRGHSPRTSPRYLQTRCSDQIERINTSGAFPRLPYCLQPSPWLQGCRSAAGPRLAVFYGDLQSGTRCPASPGRCKGCTCPPTTGHCRGSQMRRVCGWRFFLGGGPQREPARTTYVGRSLLCSCERAADQGARQRRVAAAPKETDVGG